MLSDRRQRVLGALIEEYVLRALPVGSRTLVEHYKLGVSPATVRNELSVLEEAGYILQPHTSAGRIPTDTGYRAFVDELLAGELAEEPEEPGDAEAVRNLRESASELDQLLEQTTAALARLTNCLSIVLPPTTITTHVRQVSFISMTPHQVLIVVVTEEGQVFNRHVDFAVEVDTGDLAHAQEVVNNIMAGKQMHAHENADSARMAGFQDELASVLLEEVSACLMESESVHAHRLGLSTLLKQPEFEHSQALIPILQVLEDDTVMLNLLHDAVSAEDAVVRIGSENGAAGFDGVSVVASKYGRGDSAGVVAVIGPTRMKYAQVIRAVRTARDALNNE